MPNPLSQVNNKAEVVFAKGAAEQRPLHCAQIIKTTSSWAMLESTVGVFFSKLLGAESEKGAAIFNALISSSSQDAAFDAAASFVLGNEDKDALAAVRAITRAPRDQRNQMAHGIWGHSPQMQDAILLMPPKLLVNFVERSETYIEQARAQTLSQSTPTPDLDKSQILVYRHTDFEFIQGQISIAQTAWLNLKVAVFGGISPFEPSREEARHRLLALPDIRARINKARQSRGELPLPPPEERPEGQTPQ